MCLENLSRQHGKTYHNGTAPVGYVYDVNPNGTGTDYPVGRLSQVKALTPASGAIISNTKYIYDSMGRVTASTQDTGGASYPFSYIYNDLSLDTETYPSGRKVESCYDSAGRVSKLQNVTQLHRILLPRQPRIHAGRGNFANDRDAREHADRNDEHEHVAADDLDSDRDTTGGRQCIFVGLWLRGGGKQQWECDESDDHARRGQRRPDVRAELSIHGWAQPAESGE